MSPQDQSSARAAPPRAAGSRELRSEACLLALPAAALVLDAVFPGSSTASLLRLLFLSLAPGWLLALALGMRPARDPGRTWVRALVFSPLPTALFTLALARGLGLGMGTASQASLWLTVFGLVARLGFRATRGRAVARQPLDPGLWPALALAALGVLLLWPEGARVSYHGLLHTGLVAQLHVGVFPPDHLSIGGQPLDFYWLFHWWLLTCVEASGADLLVVSPLCSLACLVAYVWTGAHLVQRFTTARRAALWALAACFVGNALLPLVFSAGVWMDATPAFVRWPFQWLSPGVPAGDPRLVTLFAKFLNFNGFPLGLAAWALLLDELTPDDARSGRLARASVALTHLLFFHPTTALGAFASLPLALLGLEAPALRARAWARAWRRLAPPALAFAVSLAVASPYLWNVLAGSPALGGAPLMSAAARLRFGAAGLLFLATPLVPAVLWGLASARVAGRAQRFLTATTVLLVLAGVCAPLPDNNQYKLLLMAFLPAGALWVAWAERLGSPRGPRRGVLPVLLALVVASHGLTAAAYRLAPSAWRVDVAGDGLFLRLPGNPELDAALHWLRDSAPPDALVIGARVPFNDSPVRAVSGRAAYLLDGGVHTRGHLEVAHRLGPQRRLFEPGQPVAPQLEALQARVERPLFVLLERAQGPAVFDRRRVELAREPRLAEVYSGRDVVLFAVREAREQ